MKFNTQSILLWVLSFVLMAALGIYQRLTGPTYPVSGNLMMNGQKYPYVLLRSHDSHIDAPIVVKLPDSTKAIYRYKRFKSHDNWTTQELVASNGQIETSIPRQPAAGKVEYQIAVYDGEKYIPLTEDPVVIRFKGAVPAYILIPHIFFMFFAMVFSIRTGFEALLKRKKTLSLTTITMFLFLVGGLILGPIVQKYAFDAYWTGWPWGHDLTDNKTIVAFIFWLIAWFVLRRKPENRVWPIVATVVMLMVYLIPHSVLGSEIDHTKAENTEKTEVVK